MRTLMRNEQILNVKTIYMRFWLPYTVREYGFCPMSSVDIIGVNSSRHFSFLPTVYFRRFWREFSSLYAG